VQNFTVGTIVTSTQKIPVGSWFRVEGMAVMSPNNGQVETRLFWPLDAQVPIETDTSTAHQNTGPGPASGYAYGPNAGIGNAGPVYMTGLGLSNAGYLGPVSLTAAPSLGYPARTRLPLQPVLTGRGYAGNPGAPLYTAPMPPGMWTVTNVLAADVAISNPLAAHTTVTAAGTTGAQITVSKG
jgi:hypothetical protein